jgi:AcrR family transcriptional regulator
MRSHPRLPSRERRDAIIAAVRTTFAEKGFDRTTTRELVRAAGVSEALLYKPFPSKESLHAAMLEACAASPELAEFGRALARRPRRPPWCGWSTSWSRPSSSRTTRRR